MGTNASSAEEFNLATHFLDANLDAGRADEVALITDVPGEGAASTTYLELVTLSNRIGNVLGDAGVRPEQRVLLALADGPLFVASWFAVLKLGAVVAEVYTFLQPKDYGYYLRYMEAGVVIADASTAPAIREIRGECSDLHTVIVADAGEPSADGLEAGGLPPGELSLVDALADASEQLAPAPTTNKTVGLWKFTTGSTGAPKAAVHAHGHPLVSHELYARGVLELSRDDVILPVPKLFFGYARDLTALFPFGVGARGVVFPDRSTPERMFELIERHRPTILVQVPTMMGAMVTHERAAEADLSSLRLAISSGETLPGPLHRRWLELFGVEVVEGVGSSELYHIYVSNRPGRGRIGSAGLAVPGYDLRLIDEEGNDVPHGEPGQLVVRGDSAALCYWDDAERSERTFAGNTVNTGDLFAEDDDGYLFYRGRADSLLKVGGIWVAPLEVEECLRSHPAVAECAVVGRTRDGLVMPAATVVLERSAAEPSGDDLIAHVRAHLSPHKAPRLVEFASELPKTASGKVDRAALAAKQ